MEGRLVGLRLLLMNLLPWTRNREQPHNEMVPQPSWRKVAGLWYLCISLGFVLLGIRAMLLGAPMWTVILRWVIAAGFLALALLEQRERKG